MLNIFLNYTCHVLLILNKNYSYKSTQDADTLRMFP